MLRFFLAIRKKLIEQENIRKYLLYALGEILLVVIGILRPVRLTRPMARDFWLVLCFLPFV